MTAVNERPADTGHEDWPEAGRASYDDEINAWRERWHIQTPSHGDTPEPAPKGDSSGS